MPFLDRYTEKQKTESKFLSRYEVPSVEEEKRPDFMQRLRAKLPTLPPVQEMVGGLAERGLEKWREKTVPTPLREARGRVFGEGGEIDIILGNILKQGLSVPRFPIDIAQQVMFTEEGKVREPKEVLGQALRTIADFAEYGRQNFENYATYVSPLSSPEVRQKAIEQIAEDPLGLFFCTAILKGGIRGGKKIHTAVKEARRKKGLAVDEPPVEQVRAVTEIPEEIKIEEAKPKKKVYGKAEMELAKELKKKGVGEEISEWQDIKDLDAQIRTIKSPRGKEGYWEVEIGVQESLGEAGGDILTRTFNKKPTVTQIRQEIIDNYKTTKAEINQEAALGITAKSGREVMIEGAIDKVLTKKKGVTEKPARQYFTLKKAQYLSRTSERNFKEMTDAQLQKTIVKLRDYNRYIENPELYGDILAKGDYYVEIIDPSATGITPKDMWLQSNLKFALDVALKEKNRRTVSPKAVTKKPAPRAKEPWRYEEAKKQIGYKQKRIKELEVLDDWWAKEDIKRLKSEINEYLADYPELKGKPKLTTELSESKLKIEASEMLEEAELIRPPSVRKGPRAYGVQVAYDPATTPEWFPDAPFNKAQAVAALKSIAKDGLEAKNPNAQSMMNVIERWSKEKYEVREYPKVFGGELKAGDRVKIKGEWYTAKPSPETGEVRLVDGKQIKLDIFEDIPVEEIRRATQEGRAKELRLEKKRRELAVTEKVKPEKLKTVEDFLTNAEKKARERIKKRGIRLTAGIDPAEMADYAIIGTAKIGKGAIKFADWSVEMVREFGDRIKPYLRTIYTRSQEGLPRFKANAEIDLFRDYFEDIQAPKGFRPPRKPARATIRERLQEEGLKGKELTSEVDAEFIRAVRDYGIALRQTKTGKIQPAIREAGTYVPEDFATYTRFKDAKAGVFGGTKDATRFVQEIDGALPVEAKAKLPGGAGPTERYVMWRTRDITKFKLNWTTAMKSRLATISKDLSKEQTKLANQVIEHISRKGAYVDPAKLVTNPKISAITTDLNVIRFAQEGRKLYESLLRHQNELRRSRGQGEIPHRDYYTAHSIHNTTIWERALGHNKAPEQIIGPGLPDYIKPNAPFNPRAVAREIGLPETIREMNLKRLLERYIETAAKDIFNTSIVQNNKAFIQQLRSMGYEHAARGLENWTAEAFTGVKASVDRAAGLSPTIHRGMNRFRGGLIRSVFPLNFAWNTFVQTSSGVLTVTRYGVRNSIRGLYDWFGNKKIRQKIENNAYSAIIKSQRSGRISRQDINRGIGSAERLNRGKLEKASDAANFFSEQVERHLTGWSVATAKRHGGAVGLKGKALWEYASDGGAKTQSMYNLEDLPGMLRSEIIKTTAPFQTFSFEMFNTLKEFAGKTGTPPATAAIRIKMVLRFLAGATAVNYIGQAAIGRKPWELSSFIPFYGTFLAPVSAALKGEGMSQVSTRGLPSPIGIGIKGGQAVHKGLLKPGLTTIKELIKTRNFNVALGEFMATGKWDKLRRFTIRYLSGFAGIPGGTQMNRIVDGFIATSAGGMVGSTDRLMFPITDTKDKIRSFFAGPWSTKGGQDYWDKRGKELDLDIEFLERNPFLRDVAESIPIVSDFYKFQKEGKSQIRLSIERMLRRGDEKGAREKWFEWNTENPDNKITGSWFVKQRRKEGRP